MKLFADLHLHSRFSRACSKDLTIENIEHWARKKGLNLLGTGDFTHPEWIKELKRELKEDETGIYRSKTGFPFVLQAEISNIYTQDGKGRRVHSILLAPNFETVEQITEWLGKKGRLDYDGRPIFGFSCIELVENLKEISKEIEIIPAHCLLPHTLIHSNPGLKAINEFKVGQKVLTHKGRYKEVKEIYNRKYRGFVYRIQPRYFSIGLTTTEEHPFFGIKTLKNCSWSGGICKPNRLHRKKCRTNAYKNYKPQWIKAKDLEVGDVLIYPRLKETKDITSINYNGIKIQVSKEFCRLVGYYLAEGYTNSRDGIGFSFNEHEDDFVNDVKHLLASVFELKAKKGKTKGDVIVYSKKFMRFFEENYYASKKKRAQTKALTPWMLLLPLDKQAEILKGWWYGDKGSTSSRLLSNQMKIICLRLGIIPSIRIDTKEAHNLRGKHTFKGRTIEAKSDNFVFDKLSFFEDKFGLLKDKYFAKFKAKKESRYGWMDNGYAYMPIFKIEKERYNGYVYNLEVEEDNSYVSEFATVHNCWTPWFSVFGSSSGFNSMEDCFKEKTKEIFALETGLSSDPEMNWRLSKMDRFTLISNSDSHSYWPWRMGRECNILDIELSYKNLIKAIRTGEGFSGTVEVDPNYGKYHLDGHRNCNVCLEPKESLKLGNKCPKCKRELTIGVLHRIEELADRPTGYKPKGKPPFYKLVPLAEIIAGYLGAAQPSSKKVFEVYDLLIGKFGNELKISLNINESELKKVVDEKLAGLIIKNREGKIKVTPGYDGVYGVAQINGIEKPKAKKQKSLGEF